MFKQVFSGIKQLVLLLEDVQKLKSELKDVRLELRDLTDVVRQMRFDEQNGRDMSERDYRELLLRLQLTLERFERRLPPSQTQDEPNG